jgi:hypothetical protein
MHTDANLGFFCAKTYFTFGKFFRMEKFPESLNLGFGAACCSGWILPNFLSVAQPQGHEMSKISHTEPS